jgi:hypothetical protein
MTSYGVINVKDEYLGPSCHVMSAEVCTDHVRQ